MGDSYGVCCISSYLLSINRMPAGAIGVKLSESDLEAKPPMNKGFQVYLEQCRQAPNIGRIKVLTNGSVP